MTEPGRSAGSDGGGRRRKRFLSPSQKYEIWVGLLRGEYSTREAADRAGVDRSTWTGRRDHALLLLGVQTGLRVSELASLRCQDLNLGAG
jgi:integrase